MASSSSQPLIQSMEVNNGNIVKINPMTMKLREHELKVQPKLIIDFESLRANGYHIKDTFQCQGWLPYFEFLNGPMYTNLVKYFQVRSEVFREYEVDYELIHKQEESEENKGKNRQKLGLKEFTEI
jgi:hypothetical protein